MRPASPLLVSAALMVAAADATAMGFGRVLSRTTLGEPLNMAVALRLDPGESLEDGCVTAVVVAGDNRVAAEDVRVRITGGGDERILRVSTRTAIDEPVVNVTLSVGCPPRLTREFVTLADPPGFTPAQAAPVAPVPRTPPSAQAAPAAVAPPRVGEGPSAAPRPPRSTPAPAAAATPPPPRRVATAPPAPRPRPAAPAPAPRLRLDMTEPVRSAAASIPAVAAPAAPVAAPVPPPAPVASAVVAAPPAAPAADDARVRALEEELARMRAEAKAQRDALTALQSRLAQVDRPAAADAGARWLPWLLGLLLALLAGLLVLAMRVRRLAAEQALVQRSAGGDSSLLPGANGESRPSPWAPARLPDEVEVTEHESTQSPPVPQPDTMPHETPHPAPASLRQEVSIEEQIDLEQQADFFSALGQDDQAIDLLVTHLRGTGGANPMPYLKLMDIHRRRGEREAYERTRERFNLRFNAVAPDWDADPRGGRTLEDYPQVLARLEQAWWQPLDAMTELETLLFQRGPSADRFDMAAYQELVMLYRMAREQRLDEETGGSSQVDVLLPLEGAGSVPPAMQVRHVDIGPTTVTPPSAIDIELPGPFELDLPRDDDAKPRQ